MYTYTPKTCILIHMTQITIKIEVELYERLKESARLDSRSMSGQILHLLNNRLLLESISEALRSEKKIALAVPAKNEGLKPVVSKFTLIGKINNLNIERAEVLEFCQDEDTARSVDDKYDKQIAEIQSEINQMEGQHDTSIK